MALVPNLSTDWLFDLGPIIHTHCLRLKNMEVKFTYIGSLLLTTFYYLLVLLIERFFKLESCLT